MAPSPRPWWRHAGAPRTPPRAGARVVSFRASRRWTRRRGPAATLAPRPPPPPTPAPLGPTPTPFPIPPARRSDAPAPPGRCPTGGPLDPACAARDPRRGGAWTTTWPRPVAPPWPPERRKKHNTVPLLPKCYCRIALWDIPAMAHISAAGPQACGRGAVLWGSCKSPTLLQEPHNTASEANYNRRAKFLHNDFRR